MSSFGPTDPCGLWQSEQAIFAVLGSPVTASGCAEMRRVWARCSLWHEKQTSACVALFRTLCSLAWMVWQSVQATPRLSCWLPVQCRRSPVWWHDMHTLLRAATGDAFGPLNTT